MGLGRTNSSGSALNFAIKSYSTEALLKADKPKPNTIGVITSTAISSYALSPKQPPYKSINKNLIPYPFFQTTRNHNGVDFTDNKDGTVKANGKNTGSICYFRITAANMTENNHNVIMLPAGKYTFSGCPSGGSDSTFYVDILDSIKETRLARDVGSGATFDLTEDTYLRITIRIASGATVSNLVFKPQLERGSAATDFIKGDATGQLWIVTGDSSEYGFNAVKGSGIYVYPVVVQQLVSGKWTDKTAMIYQKGAWSSFWDGKLYLNGNEYSGVTGGWEIDSTSEKNSASIRVGSADAATKFTGQAKTKNKINLTNFSKIEALISEAYSSDTTGFATLRVLDGNNAVVASKQIYSSIFDSSNMTVNLDISSVNGDYYVDIVAGHTASSNRHSRVTVTSVRCVR